MDAGMKQICISFYTITVERQVTAYIDLRVKLHHGDGLTEGDPPPPPLQTLSYFPNYIQTKFQGLSYICCNGAKL